MKNIIKFFVVSYLLLINDANSQQMVQNINDVYKLKENKTLFIDRPLKDLLKEIRPEIKTAHVFNEDYFVFIFKFTTIEQQRQDQGSFLERVALFVYVKDSIPWGWKEKPKGTELNWTSDDVQKFGNFIVTNVSVVYPKQD
ncbi:hypothetical protein HYN56_08725 [Flavobacterium crocinum]|uniref:Uncharacterized protein n=1 Tax=Flavobacterium crocinum TaxID=2183896 RepID=A0A2S1YJS7_9FLAO|nr:hypothetical protein [Flavobacterium crocinum]AWK04315.1 hypothetical protein HYN56_08725 [Flavobacterium crocinum]